MNKKIEIYSHSIMVIILLIVSVIKIDVNAKEQAQVIYDFMEITEDIAAYSEPDESSEITEVIPKGEKVLIISKTADNWYQILYHEQILYIADKKENLEQIIISEEVVKEIEENREETQELTSEEMKILIEEGVVTDNSEISQLNELAENNRKTELISKTLLGVLFVVVVVSGIGYQLVRKKEEKRIHSKAEISEIYIEDLELEEQKDNE